MNNVDALEIGKRIYKKHFYNIGEKVSEKDFISYVVDANIALARQIAKKPIQVDSGVYDYPYDYECPNCRKNVDELDHHCKCGQKIDWS